MDKLAEFLRSASGRDFRLGEHDCGLWLADWYVAATGKPDPAAFLRGKSYENSELEKHLTGVVDALGLARVGIPERGDIGLLAFGSMRMGAICTGARWAVLGQDGISALPPARVVVLKAWKVA